MRSAIARFFDKFGYYVLALVCVAAVVLSSVWTNQQRQAEEQLNMQAAADNAQRLSDVTFENQPASREAAFSLPLDTAVLRGFSRDALYVEGLSVWRAHPAVDFYAETATPVKAMYDGIVTKIEDGAVTLSHGGNRETVYKPLSGLNVQVGSTVTAGQVIGTSGGTVRWEDATPHVCVACLVDGVAVDFLQQQSDLDTN